MLDSLPRSLRRTLNHPAPAPAVGRRPHRAAPAFTQREQEVLALLAGGPTNRWIAERLAISERTVETHVANILGKLGLARRSQVIVWLAAGTASAPASASAPLRFGPAVW